MAEFSPMMQQYLQIKEEHPDEILFFRLGDFYEMFFDDALLASKELDLTLTGRGCGQEERAPMCGVPYHSVEAYLARLIAKGYKVAICEQMEDPALAKGLVKRDIIRVVTPGTVIEQQLLDEGSNNYLVALWPEGDTCGLCAADITTGEIRLTQLSSALPALVNELASYAPSEVLLPASCLNEEWALNLKARLNTALSALPENLPGVDETLAKRFPQDASACTAYPLGKKALVELLAYLKEMQKTENTRFERVQVYDHEGCLRMGATERTCLELTQNIRTGGKSGSLFGVLDQTKTGMGRRYLKQAVERPLTDRRQIERRLDGIEELMENGMYRLALSASMDGIYDLERLLTRILYNSVTPRELKSLENTLAHLPNFYGALADLETPIFREIYNSFDPMTDLSDLLSQALSENPPITIKEGDVFKPGYSAELDEIRDVLKNGRAYLTKIEADEKEKTGIKNMKIAYNKVFGYYLEVSKSNLSMVPDYFIRKQTLTTGERYITQELKELENRILTAGEQVIRLETALFAELKEKILQQAERISAAAKAIEKADFLCSLATVAGENHYCRPALTDGDDLQITEGRHAVVERNKDLLFVANDTDLNCRDAQVMIITGPNMAGKSTYMRQVALIVILAQMGSFVPATSATIGICDQIFTRIGASDDLNGGQSTFMVEMHEMANILKNATPKSLVLLDEVGRGTSTFDGMSIARAAAIYLATEPSVKARTLFATHYHELCSLEEAYEGIVNYTCTAKKRGDKVIFLRRIIRGGCDDSFGIEVAKLAGVPDTVIEKAREILSDLESGDGVAIAPIVHHVAEEKMTGGKEAIARLKAMDPTTLTPLEAMQQLFELKKLSEES